MTDNFFCNTDRLMMRPLSVMDNSFIFELVNSEGWLKFIGNRNVQSPDDAISYIQKILANENITYWVVIISRTQEKIGIITYIKRDYLEYYDIGFAFLQQFGNKGYAYEATVAVLDQLVKKYHISHILATTIPENIKSIKLLTKIGLNFEKELEIGKEKLQIYGAPVNKLILI